VPVVSAVGHETDVTLADLVADVRAPTPSAAAELCTPDSEAVRDDLRAAARALSALMRDDLEQRTSDLDAVLRGLHRVSPTLRAEQLRQKIDDRARSLFALLQRTLLIQRERLAARDVALAALNPAAVLDRGYALVSDAESGALVRSVQGGYAERPLHVRVADGTFAAVAAGKVEEQ
jgi:exodeoxyribonuclease VII large subunit